VIPTVDPNLVCLWVSACLLKNNVKNFHRSLTTVVRTQNDTSKTVNITDTICNRKWY